MTLRTAKLPAQGKGKHHCFSLPVVVGKRHWKLSKKSTLQIPDRQRRKDIGSAVDTQNKTTTSVNSTVASFAEMILLQRNDDIRGRLINSFGIFDPWFKFIEGPHAQAHVSTNDIVKSLPTIASNQSISPKAPTRIRFNLDVRVYEIPSHKEYSTEEKKCIWSNSTEIRLNMQRNRREFASEKWNWEQVVEEDGMFFDKASKEYIHPVHLGGIADLC